MNFTVANPFVTVTSPNTNVAWTIGSSHNLTFSHNLGAGQAVSDRRQPRRRRHVQPDHDLHHDFDHLRLVRLGGHRSRHDAGEGPRHLDANPAVTDISNVNFRIQ